VVVSSRFGRVGFDRLSLLIQRRGCNWPDHELILSFSFCGSYLPAHLPATARLVPRLQLSCSLRWAERQRRGFLIRAHGHRFAKRGERQSVKLSRVNPRFLFRFLLPALISVPVGFVLLALAAQNEPSLPVPLVMLFSPGLKLAELFTPHTQQSLGATFGWFLRIAIAVNAAYYFLLFVLLASLFGRSRPVTAQSRQ
jgi:hypothetical protein